MAAVSRRGGASIVAALMLIAGCGGQRVRRSAFADPAAAYLYGRFFMKTAGQASSPWRLQAIKFVLRCQDGNTYVFGSTAKRDVQVLRIAPTRCWFVETVYKDSRSNTEKHLDVVPPLQRPLDFAAGQAHYLGDYFAKGESEITPGFMRTHFHWEMFVDPADDRYESTTAEMRRVYPNLEDLPAVDARLVPRVERKRDNGVALAPGEPPLSPERVARVAPFIKRNYASPGDCEAACPTGQCLPYRGESGPAIACVTLCNTDTDCPEGLGCNCPTSGGGAGAACRRIAGTPQDPMARFCLSVETGGQRR
jgi:hypothetical protein